MQPAGKIAIETWMKAQPLRAVLAAMAGAGIGARLVGGCVRNTLIGRPVDEIDIAVDAAPDAVMAALAKAGVKAVPTGIEHGTVTAVADGRGFEITSLRRDVETDGRRATVAFTDDWLEDAKRRDFTFNAMYLDGDGTLYDPFGGRADIAAGRVRFVGDAHARIAEDFLRVFRFFRFFAWYGRPPMDEAALEACAAASGQLARLSAERVQKEMLKLLAAPDPVPAVTAMINAGALRQWLPEAGSAHYMEKLQAMEAKYGLAADGLRRLAAVLDDEGQAHTTAARWKLSSADRARLVALCRWWLFAKDLRERGWRRAAYAVGTALAVDLLALARAHMPAQGDFDAVADLAMKNNDWVPPSFPLRGADVTALGVAAGPRVGQLLADVERWWVDGDFAADRDACLAELKRKIAGAP